MVATERSSSAGSGLTAHETIEADYETKDRNGISAVAETLVHPAAVDGPPALADVEKVAGITEKKALSDNNSDVVEDDIKDPYAHIPDDQRGTAGLRRPWWSYIPFTRKIPPPPPPRSMDAAIRSPQFSAGLIGRHIFTWVEPMMVLGTQRTIEATDLWELEPQFASAELLSNRLNDIWNRRQAEAAAYNARLANGEIKAGIWPRLKWTLGRGNEETWRQNARKRASLVWTCNELVGSLGKARDASESDMSLNWWWIGCAYKLFGDSSQMMSPLVIRYLINYVRRSSQARAAGVEPPSIGQGVGAAIGLSLMLLTASICNHSFFIRSTGSGVLLRGALISFIFNRGLRLTGEERAKGLGNGKLTNHISTDVSRIDFAAGFFHLIITAPVQMTICLILLCVNLGWPAVIGFAFFVLVAPAQDRAMKVLMRERMKAMVYTDKRAKLVGELLSGIKIIKFFAWEIPYLDRLNGLRSKELSHIAKIMVVRSANMALAFTLPVLSSVISFVIYAAVNNGIDAADIFASLSLFQLLRMPLMMLPLALSSATDAKNAFNRLTPLFEAATLAEMQQKIDLTAELAIDVRGASFAWDSPPPIEVKGKGKKKGKFGRKSGRTSPVIEAETMPEEQKVFSMTDVNLQIPKGQLVAIVGSVGCGKSSLVQGLIGEMKRTAGSVTFSDRLGYAPQTAWIQNATIRDNILFGQPYDEEKYWKVIAAAELEPDLKTLQDGDLTSIGERGINLSGGQRQRVSVARLLYSDAPIVFLDDPLSAVDAHVGKSLFFGAIQGALAGKTRVLVTNALHFLPFVDSVIIIDNGQIVEHGTYEELIASEGELTRLMRDFGNVEEEEEELEEEEGAIEDAATAAEKQARIKGIDRAEMTVKPGERAQLLMSKEEQATGSVGFQVFKQYFQAGRGVILVPMIILMVCLSQVATVMTSYILIWWQEDHFNRGNNFYMGLYGALAVAQALFTFLLGAVLAMCTFWASVTLHRLAIKAVLRAPQSFFDTTPLGRIQNRFGKDFDNLDNMLPDGMRMLITTLSQILGSVILIAVIQPIFLVGAVVVFFLIYKAASLYRMSARELRRNQNVLRSSVFSTFGESLSGLSTIRAYGRIRSVLTLNYRQVDHENRAYYMTISTQRHLGIRLDFLGNLLVFTCAIIAITVHSLSPAEVGLALGYVIGIVQSLAWLVRQVAEVENDSTSAERVLHYANNLEPEAPAEIPETAPPANWPTEGCISFNKVFMSYRPGLPNVLKGLSLEVGAAEKIGVVGRTGAGKSTIMNTLFRLQELNAGSITIDGIDISTIGLTTLRSGLAILPQEPTLLSGTIRSNLDPFGIYDDARLNDALKRAYLTELDPATGQPKFSLDSPLEDEGLNLSVGERSLVSLARALARDAKIIVLDEATASVDLETDAKIQETIRVEFKDKTLLTIAHRLRTILAYTRIAVMDNGMVVEYDSPLALFGRTDSIFRSMCDRSAITQDEVQAAADLRDSQR